MNNWSDKTYKLILMSCFVVTMLCFVYIALVLCSNTNWDETIFAKDCMGNIGDFLSGTFGILLSFVTFILMWRTFYTQRKQFERQDQLQRQASFETTYFNLLSSLDEVRANVINSLGRCSSGIHSFSEWHSALVNFYEEKGEDTIVHPNDVSSQIEATEGKVAEIYEKFVEKTVYVGFYYRYIYNILKFATNYWEEDKEDYKTVRKYVDLLCAKLSDEELCMIFYNAISKYGRNQNESLEFKRILDKYQVFENLSQDFLIDRSHFRFYPQTDFKFLNRDERKSYLAILK